MSRADIPFSLTDDATILILVHCPFCRREAALKIDVFPPQFLMQQFVVKAKVHRKDFISNEPAAREEILHSFHLAFTLSQFAVY